MDKSSSRSYASQLRLLADWLDAREEFPVNGNASIFLHYYEKDSFLSAVRATKPGAKEITASSAYAEIKFFPANPPNGLMVQLSAPRDSVCTKIQEAVWDCEPLLSPTEVAGL